MPSGQHSPDQGLDVGVADAVQAAAAEPVHDWMQRMPVVPGDACREVRGTRLKPAVQVLAEPVVPFPDLTDLLAPRDGPTAALEHPGQQGEVQDGP